MSIATTIAGAFALLLIYILLLILLIMSMKGKDGVDEDR